MLMYRYQFIWNRANMKQRIIAAVVTIVFLWFLYY